LSHRCDPFRVDHGGGNARLLHRIKIEIYGPKMIADLTQMRCSAILHRHQHQVEGLTTAASILLTAAVGVCVALAQIVLAVGVTLLVLLTLRGMGLLENWLRRREQS
jgi:hypothetical protein